MYTRTTAALRQRYYPEQGQNIRIEPTLWRVLLIEDSKSDVVFIRRLLRDACTQSTLEVDDVPRMVDALELLDSQHFDLILLDLNLLDIDGAASVAAIHAVVPQVPIIVHSGTCDLQLKQEAMLCGARHFLVKGHESPFGFKFMIENALVQPRM